jgi:(S)-sulfolactate dehydrogenase
MARIVITEFMDTRAVERLASAFDVQYDATLVDHPDALERHLGDCEALIVRNRTQVNPALLGLAPALRVVGRLGVGLDNIDLAACKARSLNVIPATGANAQAVAEYVIGTAMLLLRGAYLSSAAVAAGEWPRAALSRGRELAGKRLGLVGFGGIGQLTARLAQGLGMQIAAYDPYLSEDSPALAETAAQRLDLDELLARCDVVSLHVPLTDDTRNLISAARLGTMKPGAVLINTARGGIVDEAALARSLRSGHLAGAALDVFADEPLGALAVGQRTEPGAHAPHRRGHRGVQHARERADRRAGRRCTGPGGLTPRTAAHRSRQLHHEGHEGHEGFHVLEVPPAFTCQVSVCGAVQRRNRWISLRAFRAPSR